MEVNEELIKRVARIARLRLSEGEIKRLIPELREILNSFSKIHEVDTEDIEPSFHPISLKNVMRDDVVEPSLSQEDSLSNVSHKKDGYFKGPKAI